MLARQLTRQRIAGIGGAVQHGAVGGTEGQHRAAGCGIDDGEIARLVGQQVVGPARGAGGKADLEHRRGRACGRQQLVQPQLNGRQALARAQRRAAVAQHQGLARRHRREGDAAGRRIVGADLGGAGWRQQAQVGRTRALAGVAVQRQWGAGQRELDARRLGGHGKGLGAPGLAVGQCQQGIGGTGRLAEHRVGQRRPGLQVGVVGEIRVGGEQVKVKHLVARRGHPGALVVGAAQRRHADAVGPGLQHQAVARQQAPGGRAGLDGQAPAHAVGRIGMAHLHVEQRQRPGHGTACDTL